MLSVDAYLHPVLGFSLECVGGGQSAAGVLPSEESEFERTAISCRASRFFFYASEKYERRSKVNSNDVS